MNKKSLVAVCIVVVIATIVILIVSNKKPEENAGVGDTNVSENKDITITITEQDIEERYFSGKKSTISGTGVLATAARNYIDETLKEFADNANIEVPERIKEYGEGNPSTNYGIDLLATQSSSPSTRSIIISGYDYRGGANGNSFYKTFTESTKTGSLIGIGDLLMKDAQENFVSFVKQKLLRMTDNGIFPESVQMLTFASLDRWSVDQNGTLTLYFDRSEIAAGAAGAIELPLSKTDINKFINPEYK